MLYSEKVMDHFRNPRNLGTIENADAVGEVGNAKSGDFMKIHCSVLAEEAVKAALFDYYSKHPELAKPEGLPDCAQCSGGCCSCS